MIAQHRGTSSLRKHLSAAFLTLLCGNTFVNSPCHSCFVYPPNRTLYRMRDCLFCRERASTAQREFPFCRAIAIRLYSLPSALGAFHECWDNDARWSSACIPTAPISIENTEHRKLKKKKRKLGRRLRYPTPGNRYVNPAVRPTEVFRPLPNAHEISFRHAQRQRNDASLFPLFPFGVGEEFTHVRAKPYPLLGCAQHHRNPSR